MRNHEFEIQFVKRFDPSNFHLMSAKSGIKLPGRTINDLFHIWELKSAQVALITMRSMAAKRPHDDNVDDQEKSENFSPRSPDSRPIRIHESGKFENSLQMSSDAQPMRNQDLGHLHHQLHPTQPSITPSHSRQSSAPNPVQTDPSIDDFHLWHRRLGHTAFRTLRKLGFVTNNRQTRPCEACAFAKQTRRPYRRYEHNTQRRLWRVHSDMSGIQEPSIDGKQYFITFIDDFSRYCWVYFTARKDAKTIHDIYTK